MFIKMSLRLLLLFVLLLCSDACKISHQKVALNDQVTIEVDATTATTMKITGDVDLNGDLNIQGSATIAGQPVVNLLQGLQTQQQSLETQQKSMEEFIKAVAARTNKGPVSQLGSDFIGVEVDTNNQGDRLGADVSSSDDGSIVAIGACFSGCQGRVDMYKWQDDAWAKLGDSITGQAWAYEYVMSLSSDGKRVAIGGPKYDIDDKDYLGRVRVFAYNNNTWTQLGSDLLGKNAFDNFGISVSLNADGSKVAIGAYQYKYNGTLKQVEPDDGGFVQVYEWSSSSWTQLGSDIGTGQSGARLGASVSFNADGSRVAIGASFMHDQSQTGYVRIYHWDTSKSDWDQLGSDIVGEQAGSQFGFSVSLSSSGSTVAVGAKLHDDNTGVVRIFNWNNTGWTQSGSDIVGEAPGDQSGKVSLSNDGSRVAIGAMFNDGGANNGGHVRIYDWIGSTWVQIRSDIDGIGRFGTRLSLSGDGSRLIVGGEQAFKVGAIYAPGVARVYHLSL